MSKPMDAVPTTADSIPTPTVKTHPPATVRWRRLQGFGGFALACSFFMPAVRGCGSDIVPCAEVYDLITNAPSDPEEYLAVFAVMIATYLFGMLTLLAVWPYYKRVSRWPDRFGRWAGVIVGAVAASILVLATAHYVESWPPTMSWEEAFWIAVAGVSLVYCVRALRRGAAGVVCVRWYSAVCCVVWFTLWAIGGARYGLFVSLLGSLCILVGVFEEARLRSFDDRPGTLWSLLLGKLHIPPPEENRCTGCGYSLRGLLTPRCPECGTPFDPARLTGTERVAKKPV